MAFTAKDVLERTLVILQDADAVRWPLAEQLTWINDGCKEIALHKPNSTASTVLLDMVEGTKQTLPATAYSLIDVIRNVDPSTSAGKAAITRVSKSDMDSLMPRWHDADFLPTSDNVRHVIDDPLDQSVFYVVPGNTGSGKIEAVVGKYPTVIAVPANPADINSYTAAVDLLDIYLGALVDYVLYRNYSKDMSFPNAASRAAGHYQMYAQAIGLKATAENAANLSRSAQIAAS